MYANHTFVRVDRDNVLKSAMDQLTSRFPFETLEARFIGEEGWYLLIF